MGNIRNVPVTRDGKRAGFVVLVKELPGFYRTQGGKFLFFRHGHTWKVQKKHNSGLPGHYEIGTGYATLSDAVSGVYDSGAKEDCWPS